MDDNFNFNSNILDSLSNPESLICSAEDCPKYMLSQENSFTIITQNIRSAWCNFHSFSTLLTRIGLLPDIIVLTECWLSVNNSAPPLDGYYTYITSNYILQNDGVIVYIRSDISSQSYEPKFQDANCLVSIIESTAIVSIYRSPSYKSIENFLDSLSSLLGSLLRYKNIVLVGDINIDITPMSTDRHAEEYLNMTHSLGFWPSHTIPTRVNSCLDHVLVRSNNATTTLVIKSSITDHDSILFSLKSDLKKFKPCTTVPKIIFPAISKDLSNLNFSPILESNDCNIATDYLVRCISDIVTKNTIYVKIPRRKVVLKQWMTPGLLRCVKHRDKLHSEVRKDPDNYLLKLTYSRYRNFCGKLIKKIKRQYDRNELESASNLGIKKTWEAINSITHRKPKKDSAQDILKSDSSPTVAVNKTNSFFANVGKNLAEKIANLDIPRRHSPPAELPNSFTMIPTDQFEINATIDSLKLLGSVGWDGISSKVIKQNKEYLISPLTHICNLALTTGIFPTAFKKAIIIPVYKAGDRTLINNYRPISILPTLSKILERLLNNRLVSYLESMSILSPNQFGFRSGKSTADAVSQLTNFIATNLDKGKKCLGIFLDLAKAFDTVSVPKLLCKLESVGVRGVPLDLFRDYLTDRVQVVRVGNYVSDPLPVTYGVPQGSILGPTLFLLYINELCSIDLLKGKIVTFADDTALLFQGDDWNDTFNCAQIGFNIINNWLLINSLTLNADKTKYMSFSIRKPRKSIQSLKIRAHICPGDASSASQDCNCTLLESVDKIKYLGVVIDCNLTFKYHIANLTLRIRRLMAIFSTLRHVANPCLLKMVYFTLCQSILTYCINSWGGTFKTYLLPLERAQRAILKVSSFKPIRYPTSDLFRECGVLTVRQLYIQCAIIRYHSSTHYSPSCATIATRRSHNISKTEGFKTCFINRLETYLGGFLYNVANKLYNIHALNKFEIKRILLNWLKPLNYEETEKLLISPLRG